MRIVNQHSQVYKFSALQNQKPELESHDELRYNCPFCITLRGKADTSAKLYYNKKFKIGHCFKCNCVLINDTLSSLEEIYQRTKDTAQVALSHSYDLSGWSFPVIEGSKSYQYLLNQRKLRKEDIARFQFRESPYFNGVIIPNTVNRTNPFITDFCQIRYFDNQGFRYLGRPGAVKPLYGKSLASPGGKLVICEGVFSAIAAYQELNLDAVALYGKEMSHDQQALIKELNPSTVFVMLDGKEIKSIYKTAKNLMGQHKVYATFLPYDKDPSECNLKDEVYNYTININNISLSIIKSTLFDLKRPNFQDKWEFLRHYAKKCNF